jgi:hypothetical protein
MLRSFGSRRDDVLHPYDDGARRFIPSRMRISFAAFARRQRKRRERRCLPFPRAAEPAVRRAVIDPSAGVT